MFYLGFNLFIMEEFYLKSWFFGHFLKKKYENRKNGKI